MFDIEISQEDLVEVDAGLLIVPCEPDHKSSVLDAIREATDVDIMALADEENFACKAGQTFVFRGLRGMKSHRVVLVGLGTPDEREMDAIREAGATAAREARNMRAKTFAVTAPPRPEDTLRFVEGIILGAYRFDRYLSKSEDEFDGFESMTILSRIDGLEAQVDLARKIANGVNFARDLVNETPNYLTPVVLAEKAREVASSYKLECTIFDEDELVSRGFNLIMAVGKGSIHPPRLVHLVYKPKGEVKRRIAFVGKGVTFDTGGYNIKPGSSMLAMHTDMAGAASVLGAARAIGEIQPEGVEIHFVTPSAENSISGEAMKPQDIFRGYGKKTVEIHNTDAEGRLILADALAYIQEFEPEVIIDLATLTGACVVALGETTAGLFSNDDTLAESILAAAKASGEDIWRMPLNKKLDKELDTPMADMKNIGSRWGGAITAALFLNRWIEDDFEGAWAHLDIAGPAYSDKESALSPAGGTGFAVSTLVELAMSDS